MPARQVALVMGAGANFIVDRGMTRKTIYVACGQQQDHLRIDERYASGAAALIAARAWLT
jgi:hypothetical protein